MPTCYTPPRCPSCGNSSSSKCDCPIYTTILGDVLTYTVLQKIHKLSDVRDVTVLQQNGDKVMLQVNIAQNKDVTINSNVSLINTTLMIY